MLYLSGAVLPSIVRGEIPNVGLMLTPNMGNNPPIADTWWAGDTGCFSQAGDKFFDLSRFLEWCERKRLWQDTCLFITAPDVVGNAEATWERSAPVLPLLRAMGYKAALVAQDGIQDMDVEWGAFDCLFIGGTTGWKLSAAVWRIVREANGRGKWVHMGRVNSEARLRTALFMGCHSADGTFLKYGPDVNLPRLQGWLSSIRLVSVPDEQQAVMEVGGHGC